MAAALQHDIEIRRGATFVLPVRWETEPWLYGAITSIAQRAPVSITSAAHTIPDGWNVAVVDAKGLTQLNAKSNPPKASDMHRATVVSATQIEFNAISSASFGKHTASTGYLAWRTPQSLVGHTARMQIKDRIGGTVLIAEAFDVHVPKGYVYFAMAFSLGVESINIRMRTARARKLAQAEPVKLRKDIPGE